MIYNSSFNFDITNHAKRHHFGFIYCFHRHHHSVIECLDPIIQAIVVEVGASAPVVVITIEIDITVTSEEAVVELQHRLLADARTGIRKEVGAAPKAVISLDVISIVVMLAIKKTKKRRKSIFDVVK